MEQAIFGAGCFWGVEAAFRLQPGVVATQAGYAGGATESPDYAAVCAGYTGHAEVVEVTFDPAQISYGELLDFFWASYPPPFSSGQYRSIILCTTPQQLAAAQQRKADLERTGQPVPTEIGHLQAFYVAEPYHQQYYAKSRRR